MTTLSTSFGKSIVSDPVRSLFVCRRVRQLIDLDKQAPLRTFLELKGEVPSLFSACWQFLDQTSSQTMSTSC